LLIIIIFAAVSFTTQGHFLIAQHLYEKSRSLLNSIFEDVLFDFNVAATYGYLATFLIKNDEVPRASFFLQNAHKYIDSVAQKFLAENTPIPSCMNVKTQFLTHLVRINDLSSEKDWNIVSVS
jgi:hypothetical protein